MPKRKYIQTTLHEQLKVIEIMSLEENKNSKTGDPNFYKLAKNEEEVGLGINREKFYEMVEKSRKDKIIYT